MVRRVALVTGGGSGIGAAAARALAGDGWTVALAGRRAQPLEEVVAAGADLPGELAAFPADVSDAGQVTALVDAVVDRFGRLDLLFNNAGRGAPAKDPGELSAEEWSAVVAVNLTGAFLCTSAAFRVMRAQRPRGGRIINNGSLAAHAPRPRSIAYTATKHAITGLTRSTALDGRPYDIACGQVDIGNAATDMGAGAAGGAEQADGSIRPEAVMDVAEAGRAVAYMASLPLDANVQQLTVLATTMPFVGRG